MRIDIVTIFPDYFSPLSLSLIGKAANQGLFEIHTHDLRDYTHDRHRTVDDTPYGGGAGMVMKPQPWGECLDAIYAQLVAEGFAATTPARPSGDDDADGTESPGSHQPKPTLIFPTPSGEQFTQSLAWELSSHDQLVFGCGRYEGIDRRVMDWAAECFDVREISLGDYVLNGGEVAVLAMVEAIGRLVPEVIGNPESLVEESHSPESGGLLEYPIYTKPALWRGLEVPAVLLSGDHGKVAEFRRQQSLELTRRRRPDLIPDQ